MATGCVGRASRNLAHGLNFRSMALIATGPSFELDVIGVIWARHWGKKKIVTVKAPC